jgi:hypothetical protein
MLTLNNFNKIPLQIPAKSCKIRTARAPRRTVNCERQIQQRKPTEQLPDTNWTSPHALETGATRKNRRKFQAWDGMGAGDLSPEVLRLSQHLFSIPANADCEYFCGNYRQW